MPALESVVCTCAPLDIACSAQEARGSRGSRTRRYTARRKGTCKRSATCDAYARPGLSIASARRSVHRRRLIRDLWCRSEFDTCPRFVAACGPSWAAVPSFAELLWGRLYKGRPTELACGGGSGARAAPKRRLSGAPASPRRTVGGTIGATRILSDTDNRAAVLLHLRALALPYPADATAGAKLMRRSLAHARTQTCTSRGCMLGCAGSPDDLCHFVKCERPWLPIYQLLRMSTSPSWAQHAAVEGDTLQRVVAMRARLGGCLLHLHAHLPRRRRRALRRGRRGGRLCARAHPRERGVPGAGDLESAFAGARVIAMFLRPIMNKQTQARRVIVRVPSRVSWRPNCQRNAWRFLGATDLPLHQQTCAHSCLRFFDASAHVRLQLQVSLPKGSANHSTSQVAGQPAVRSPTSWSRATNYERTVR